MNINVQSKHFWLNLLLLVLQGVSQWIKDELEKPMEEDGHINQQQ